MRRLGFVLVGIGLLVGYIKFVGFSNASRCGAEEVRLKEHLATLRSCSEDSDCLAMPLQCPFPCYVPIHEQHRLSVSIAMTGFQKECLHLCPDCPKQLPRVQCISGLCELR